MIQNKIKTEIQVNETLDAKGLNCPLPILKTKVLLNKMQPGEILHIEATDPLSVVDFKAYCARTNHEMLNYFESNNIFEFFIKCVANPKKF